MQWLSGMLERLVYYGCVATSIAMVIAGPAILGPADAAIPDSGTGMIHACYTKNSGATRVIDAEAGEVCLPSETSLSWPGQAGGGGGPAAFAYITDTADVDEAKSSGITDSMVTIAAFGPNFYYCFDVPFAFKNIVVTPMESQTMAGASTTTLVNFCPLDTDFAVFLTIRFAGTLDHGPFYILIH